jgi:histidinol-phosphatase
MSDMSGLDPKFLDRAVQVARSAADAAAVEIRRWYRRGVEVEIKADETPVTVADRAAEVAIVATLRENFPDHAFHGEEGGRQGEGSDYLWLIDPIDGTRSFVRGYPFFSTQIALMYRGTLVAGVSKASEFCETAWARTGGGAFLNGERVSVGQVRELRGAAISFGNLKTLASGPAWARLAELVREAERTRGYGDFYHYHLLARGAADAVIESDVNILDIAALSVIIAEAGGVFTDLGGQPVGLDTTSVLATGTPELHAHLLRALT